MKTKPKHNTPQNYNPSYAPPINHPQGAEYMTYAHNRLYPKPFWKWLEEQQPDGPQSKSALGYELQDMIDRPGVIHATRKVAIQRNKFGRVVARPTTLFKP